MSNLSSINQIALMIYVIFFYIDGAYASVVVTVDDKEVDLHIQVF